MLRTPNIVASGILRRFCSSVAKFTVEEALLVKPIDQKILVQGWVQAIRKYKNLYFVDLVDGTCFNRLQLVMKADNVNKYPTYASSIKVEGSVHKSLHKGQEIELVADSWETLGSCSEQYPFQAHQKYSSEFIRQYPHLRPRTRRFSSINRIKCHAKKAVDKFFDDEGFIWTDTPTTTHNDCEGAGEVFSVEVRGKDKDSILNKKEIANSSNVINHPKKENVSSEDSSDNSKQHFFGSPAFLTVSRQFHLEAMAGASPRVYSFDPVFRAESTQTRQHSCEFRMIEAEMAFIKEVEDLSKMVEKCIKKIVESIMENCALETQFLFQDIKNHEAYIKNLLLKPFVQMSYKESINILQQNENSLRVPPIKFGEDLASDHKQFLVKYCDNIPVFVCMFPASIKPFYMKTDENDMVYCFDLFASYGGEICGGSLREDNAEKLKKKHNFEDGSLSWYLDLREYGSVPHGGFGIGFERLLQSILGISNIRDIISFPRRKFDCKC